MKNKLLSIVIVTYNSKDYLVKCLESLERNVIKKDTEIIVVDNASTDGIESVIPKAFKSVKFIRNRENSGFAKANNLGIRKSIGKYVLLLNPDTIVPPATLSHMVKFMEANPEAGISTCMVELLSGRIDDACHRGFPTPWNAFCHFSGLSGLFPGSLTFNGYHLGYRNLKKVHEIDSCTGAFMLIRRIAGRKLGFLDEDYFWYGEDLDFCYRVKKDNWKVYFVPSVKITHYKGVSSGIKKHSTSISTASYSTKIKATRARFAVMEIFYRKHYSKTRSGWVMPLVFAGIRMKEAITLLSLKIKHAYEDRI